jgi:hypothetical protein
MTLAIILVIFAALTLTLVLKVSVSRSLQISGGGAVGTIQPIDVEAFRNLVDPAEEDYLRQRLPGSEFRRVQRQRLRAMAFYVVAAGRNAAMLVLMGQSALAAGDAQTAEAARRLVDSALLLRRNSAFALVKIYVALAWPNVGLTARPLLHDYERLSGVAMLLGRLRDPRVPVRISAGV